MAGKSSPVAVRAWHCAALALLALAARPAPAAPAADFSATLDSLWNFEQPAASERRMRAELARHPPRSREALEITTQIARTQSLRHQFAAADATLDGVAPALYGQPARLTVRYLLERGRTRNSAGETAAAVALFKAALATAGRDTLPGADFYRVDALHMLGIAAPPAGRLGWDLQALAVAEAATDPRTRGWVASLDHNIGWAYFARGDAATALVYWQKALPLREAAGDAAKIRVAKWTIARGYRELGRLDDAAAIQQALARETERDGTPDGYVYEELAEIALARGDRAAAAPWAARAHALLKDDVELRDDEPARLARLAAVAQGSTP